MVISATIRCNKGFSKFLVLHSACIKVVTSCTLNVSHSGFQLSLNQCRFYYNVSRKMLRTARIWREEHKLPAHINQTSALMNGPDYRFADGRPTPYGTKQYMRMMNQKSLAEQTVKMLGEVEFAVNRYKSKEEEKKEEIEGILERKLKPKGGVIK